ncbi:fukutin-like isoform X1 [Amphibalanus amphitrite]|uniref:fukutin-like isoform X1 n=2 Tax=Amphibalanus amphitrite TaxID=1232801 RepID=UPI001C924234|nr:fukutin-like isoform X1 [Amphibalanus amphitrite]XP_043193509.1 fukutin-like isoform X1 [Amphibalanus amphitrite]XP_043193510.1 fukutin-like isoform X1 [Amphibalanus amphitrite]XP_043193511.1 fukutin-like isoform X1 [Amphibalanus amphitrite]
MFGMQAQLLATFCGLLSVVVYYAYWNFNPTRTVNRKDASNFVDLLGGQLKADFGIFALVPCELNNTTAFKSSDCSCANEQLAGNCVCKTVCILWKEIPDSLALKSVVKSISKDVKYSTSNKSVAAETITHFFITLQPEGVLHFANWFLQEDGSWWFDQLPHNILPFTESNDGFFVGKYQGWMPRFRLADRSKSSVLAEPADRTAFVRHLLSSRFIPCDRERAHQFHLTEGRDASADAERFRHRAWRLLAAAAAALDELEVPFWLSSGTCLGYYRQCDFVPYMGDVDIGVRIASVRDWAGDTRLPSLSQIVEAMAERRLRLVHRFGLPEDSLELSFRSPDNIKLDIFFFYEDGDIMWNGGTQARTGKKFRYDFAAFELCWTEFRELRVRVPCDTERYLISNYGPEWRVPQPVWDWKSSPPNVRENGYWTPEQMDEAVQLLEP